MVEIFRRCGVGIVVDYNENIYTHRDVSYMLKDAVKDMEEFESVLSEIDIINEQEVRHVLFFKDDSVVKILDLTRYKDTIETGDIFIERGITFEKSLKNTYGITIIEDLGSGRYKLKGSKNGFDLLEECL